jgi:hypothetical protein
VTDKRGEQEELTPFGVALQEMLEKRGWNKSRLAQEMIKTGYRRSQPRQAITNAMLWAEAITFPFVGGVARGLRATIEERDRLWESARETKDLYPQGKREC